jgi:hypothetical protein
MKLGLKQNFRVALLAMPPEVNAELKEALSLCTIAKDDAGPLDFAMVFAMAKADLKRQFSQLAKQLAPTGMLWVSWPKKASGVATDINENSVREIGLDAGLVDVKVCAVNDVWSGLKFVVRLKDRR